MADRDRWKPQPLLEESEWSLIPGVGLTKRVAWCMQALWLLFAMCSVILRGEALLEMGLVWMIGAYALFYVTQRLGGREGIFSAGARVNSDSTFYERLLGDSISIFLLLCALAIVLFGLQAIRSIWSGP